MGNPLKWILGMVSAGFAAMLVYSEHLAPYSAPLVVYLVAAFCLAITIACFVPRARNASLRLIGAMVFVATVSYFLY